MNDRYQIISTLVSNGQNLVQHAWDRSLNREVAIKRPLPFAKNDDSLFHEAWALRAVQHPNIVTVYDYGTDDQGAYLVMEFIQGDTLDQTIQRGPLDITDFSALVMQSLEAVSAVHSAGLIHRDLKPENILLPRNHDGQFMLKLIDFGLARPSCTESPVTGSIHFMAPEQFGKSAADARSDLYALGCIYYYSLTGQLPFQGEEKAQVMTAHLYHHCIPLAKWRQDLSLPLTAWVESLMSLKPELRPQSAAGALATFPSLW